MYYYLQIIAREEEDLFKEPEYYLTGAFPIEKPVLHMLCKLRDITILDHNKPEATLVVVNQQVVGFRTEDTG